MISKTIAKLPAHPVSDAYLNKEALGFIPIATGIDVTEIRQQLDRCPEVWNASGVRNKTPANSHYGVDDIVLRANEPSRLGPDFMKEHQSIWYPEAKKLPAVVEFIMDTMAFVRGETLGAVVITRPPPGSTVKKHVDQTWHAKFYDKFYLQIQGHEDQTFCSDHQEYAPNTGDLYWFNNEREHWVHNRSTIDRITLIICIKVQYGRY